MKLVKIHEKFTEVKKSREVPIVSLLPLSRPSSLAKSRITFVSLPLLLSMKLRFPTQFPLSNGTIGIDACSVCNHSALLPITSCSPLLQDEAFWLDSRPLSQKRPDDSLAEEGGW